MKNYQKVNVPAGEARVELHDSLNLTGAEVSISNLPAGAGVPFVHSHKQNEEIYAVLSGRGTMVVDGETVELQAGDWLRVAPAGERQLSAAADSAISVLRYLSYEWDEKNNDWSLTADHHMTDESVQLLAEK